MSVEHDEHDDDIDDCRPGSAGSGHVVYCVHGNKWGMAECCADLEQDDQVHCHTDREEGVDKK